MKTLRSSVCGLLVMLEDEFRASPGVRIRTVFPALAQRSPDLPQDYDPEASSVHRECGVRVLTHTKEYYFPVEWFEEKSHRKIHSQIEEIRERLAFHENHT